MNEPTMNPFSLSRALCCIALVWLVADNAQAACVQESSAPANQSTASKTADADDESKPPAQSEADQFVADFVDLDLADTTERAWEYRPYQVAVWFCLDGTPQLNANYQRLTHDITRRSELRDPSGWDLTTGRAPAKWRNRFLANLDAPEELTGFSELTSLAKFDKLIVVCLESQSGLIEARVREFDLQTQQWGAMINHTISQKHLLGASVMDSIANAFMPIAKVDRIQEVDYEDAEGKARKKDEVVMQMRAIASCVETKTNADFELEVVANKSSPVFVRDTDRFLPILRSTDKNGDLLKLEPIEFTFLTVNEILGAELRCSIESSARAPLSQKKRKRQQKLALVIRPPERSTRLFLVSSDKSRTPLEGFEVITRAPNSARDDYTSLGKTDWEGSVEVPPSKDGLQIVLVRRGTRPLKRIPVIPGLYDTLTTTIPNDETRLYAEGVVQGMRNEILSLVIRREVLEGDIEASLADGDRKSSKDLFDQYRDMDSPRDLKIRLTEERNSLRILTSDATELQRIESMFSSLADILDKQQLKSKESELMQRIQQIGIEPASTPSNTVADDPFASESRGEDETADASDSEQPDEDAAEESAAVDSRQDQQRGGQPAAAAPASAAPASAAPAAAAPAAAAPAGVGASAPNG